VDEGGGEDENARLEEGSDRRRKQGAELLHLLSEGSNRPVCGIARSRFNGLIAAAECRTRIAGSFVTFD